MSRYTIRTLIILGSIAILGIISVQLYFIKRSYRVESRQLDQSIRITLQNVAEKLYDYHESSLPYENIIQKISPNYYVVNVNDVIDIKVLEFYLVKEFETRNLGLDFEYAIYDCATDRMVYGSYINLSEKDHKEREDKTFPKTEEYLYYFGIYFPNINKFILESMSVWYFISSILFIVVMFFAYSMFIILRQKRLSEIQKDFIHNITHEFKTPLTSISLSADVLQDKEILTEPERLMKYTSIIKEQAIHLHDQVLKVLQHATHENLGPSLKKERIELTGMIQEIVSGLDARLKKDNGMIHIHGEDETHYIRADKIHIKNAIINLLDNALKYAAPNPVIEIVCRKENRFIVLTVSDNGPGIDKKYLSRVYDKFFRVPTGNIHNVKGFGLGLSYVKNVVKAHNWKIKLKSVRNEGTEISIWMFEDR